MLKFVWGRSDRGEDVLLPEGKSGILAYAGEDEEGTLFHGNVEGIPLFLFVPYGTEEGEIVARPERSAHYTV